MKKIIGFILLTLLFSLSLYAIDYTLSWDANSEDDLAGYKLYYKANSSGQPEGDYDEMVDVNKVTVYTVENLDENVIYFFSVTAYDESGLESNFSEEVNTNDAIHNDDPPLIEGTVTGLSVEVL